MKKKLFLLSAWFSRKSDWTQTMGPCPKLHHPCIIW